MNAADTDGATKSMDNAPELEEDWARRYRFTLTRDQLEEHFRLRYSPAALVALLAEQFVPLYDQDAGVWECYTIADHTEMVLRQYERYFAPYPLPAGVDTSLFRLFLALHDVGKPLAIANGDKRTQHRYTWPLMKAFYAHLNIDGAFVAVSEGLLHYDPIGAYLRGRRERRETERIIREQARAAGMSTREYFRLLIVYYKVDAGSYTADAGGRASLDFLFEFDRETPALRFSAATQQQIEKLEL